jgi:hypothetical protein
VRLLIFPATLFGIAGFLAWTFGDRLVFPEEFDEVVVWLRSHGEYAWAVGGSVILADALLPVPSTAAMFSMGIIYGPLLGGFVSGTVMAALGAVAVTQPIPAVAVTSGLLGAMLFAGYWVTGSVSDEATCFHRAPEAPTASRSYGCRCLGSSCWVPFSGYRVSRTWHGTESARAPTSEARGCSCCASSVIRRVS